MKSGDNGKDFVAHASTTIEAPVAIVWQALTDPDLIEQYMFGTKVVTDWRKGSPITWQGEWQGTSYKDKGVILEIEPQQLLKYSHYSPLSGKPDVPENYHTVTIELSREGEQSVVLLSQDNNDTEEARAHSEENWQSMLEGLKNVVES